jgi:AraC-like DNA-binding protein
MDMGLGDALLSVVDGTVPVNRVTSALERLAAVRPDAPTVLRIGAELTPSGLQLVGLTLMTATSLRAQIASFVRFSPLVAPGTKFDFSEDEASAQLSFDPGVWSPQASTSFTELILGATATFAHEQGPRRPGLLRRVTVTYAAPAYAQAYEQLLQCPVHFGSASHTVFFEPTELDLMLPGGDLELHGLLSRRAHERLIAQQEEDALPLSQRVRVLLAGDQVLDIERLAEHFDISVSTLQRRLKHEGTTFTLLVDEVRREIALEAMTSTNSHIKELSERLGFSEPSAFYRAFRRWTGRTTRKYRKQKP